MIEIGQDKPYDSSNTVLEAFSKMISSVKAKFLEQQMILYASWIETPLGPMIAIAGRERLYLLEFFERPGLEREIEKLCFNTQSCIIAGVTPAIDSITIELQSYFAGKLQHFTTPLQIIGTPFQQLVWQQLLLMPYGTTKTYLEQAVAIGHHQAYRAVARANGANQLALIIPCHRIINSNGALGGYGGGIHRKQWLLEFERHHV
jgi:AraC family transcriptional regulator of adaptative response/methylated-DNA-[protein]-cysteine methyltransferase